MIRAGKLRHRITIQQQSGSQDSFGEPVNTWVEFATVWGSVEPLSGREFLEGRSIEAEVSTRIRIRYLAGVLPEMRAVFGSHIYNILSVLDLEGRNHEIALMCQELPS